MPQTPSDNTAGASPPREQPGSVAQAQLADTLALADCAAICVDVERRITLLNRRAEELFGYARDELLGQPLALIIPELGGAGQAPARLESRCVRKDGTTFGTVVGTAHIAVDGAIVVAALVHEARAPLLDGLPDAPAHDESTSWARAKSRLHAHAARLGILAEASHIFAQASTDERAVLDLIARVTAEPLGASCMVRLLAGDGNDLPIVTIYDPDPEVQAALDATYRRVTVRISDPNMSALVVRTGQPLLMPAVDMDVVRALALPGLLPVFERFGPSSIIVVPLRARGATIGALSFTRHTPGLPAFTADDLTLAHDLADRAALAIANARLFQQAQHELAERQLAEQALETERALLVRRVDERTADLSRANAELERAVRAKDEFLATMSHELRTPLNAILGISESLLEQYRGPLNERQQEMLGHIESSGRHLLALINDILDLSKIEAGRMELQRQPVSLSDLCESSLLFVREQAVKKRLSLALQLNDQQAMISVDPKRLKQILVNLLSNAVKFTPAGGRVSLEVEADVAAGAVRFRVSDTGIGMSAEDLGRLFQPFVQLDSSLSRSHEGTGLGLALVRRLAELHGGSVAVESEPGAGSSFTVVLPYAPPEAVVPRPAAQPAGLGSLRSAFVLEDALFTGEQLARYLQELGIDAFVYERSAGAVEEIARLRPGVILLDLQMPGLSGWEVLARLKADPELAAIPVIIVSVLDERPRGLAAGAVEYLLKPISRDLLRHALEAAAAPPAVVVSEPSPPRPAPTASGAKILLAEDNEFNIVAIGDYLQSRGYRLTVARNGREALELAEEARPDLILMDVQMPELDGLAATRRLRADPAFAATPIVALTALAMPGDRERCLAAGADEYMTKPVSLRALAELIERLLAGRPHPGHPHDATPQGRDSPFE